MTRHLVAEEIRLSRSTAAGSVIRQMARYQFILVVDEDTYLLRSGGQQARRLGAYLASSSDENHCSLLDS